MGDDRDLFRRDAKVAREDGAAHFGHCDEPGGGTCNALQNPPLILVRFRQYGVERGHDRRPQLVQHGRQMLSRSSTEDPELMLDTDDVGIERVDMLGRG